MKKAFHILITMLIMGIALASCTKAPYLTLTGSRSLSFKAYGGSENISFTCNRAWTVSSSESWIKVSPANGEANESGIKVSISCDANTSYDARTATVTIRCEELSETISISQDTNYGLMSNPTTFNLTNEAQTIDVEVKANVEYDVVIDDAAKDWISQVGTKALSSTKISFSIAKNETYDNREGKITIQEKGGSLSQVITVKQSQTDEIILSDNEYNIDGDEQDIEIEVSSNIQYSVEIDEAASAWLTHAETKALNKSTAVLHASQNDGAPRHGKVLIKHPDGSIEREAQVYQKTALVKFEDDNFKGYCVSNFDVDGDGEISMLEAINIKTIDFSRYRDLWITSLRGVEAFKSLETFAAFRYDILKITSADFSSNKALKELYLDSPLEKLDIPETGILKALYLVRTQFESLDLSKQASLEEIYVSGKNLKNLNIKSNSKLNVVIIEDSEKLESVDLPNDIHLNYLRLYNLSYITSLNFEEKQQIDTIEVQKTNIHSIDLSEQKKLRSLSLGGNSELSSLTLKGCNSLSFFSCIENSLSSIDFSDCDKVEYLSIENNHYLNSIFLTNNNSLRNIRFCNNDLTSLDISGAPNLESGTFTGNPKLETIYVPKEFWEKYYNNLSTLGVSLFSKDEGCEFYIKGDENLSLPTKVKEALTAPLNNRTPNKKYNQYKIDLNDDSEISRIEAQLDTSMVIHSGVVDSVNEIVTSDWLEYFPNLLHMEWEETGVKSLDLSAQTKLKDFLCIGGNKGLESINLSKCIELTSLILDGCAINNLDISANLKITELSFSGNSIKRLPDFTNLKNIEKLSLVSMGLCDFDVSQFPNLTELYLNNNNLSVLDLSGQKLLKMAWCQNNKITEIKLDGCESITWLHCSDNNLSTIDVSQCAEIMERIDTDNNPNLFEIWLRKGQSIRIQNFDPNITTIKYKD